MKKDLLKFSILGIAMAFTAENAFAAMTISNGKATNDASTATYEFSYGGAPTFFRAFIDGDRNSSTGFLHAGIGADFVIENGNLYKYTGTTSAKTLVGPIESSSTLNGQVKYVIERSAIGETATNGEGSDLVFEIANNSNTKRLAKFTQYYTSDNPIPPTTHTQPMCVWNQAYQENYKIDAVADMVANAKGCYTLIEPFESIPVRQAIPALKQNGNIVGCYISVGTCENWRDDYNEMKPFCVTKQWGEWPGEYFVNTTTTGVLDVMKKRVDKMASWGCDMVEFDNMDWIYDKAFRKNYQFLATEAEGAAYNQAICTYIKSKGMKCMAKNSTQNAENFDGLTLESYNYEKNWWEPAMLTNMLNAGKPGIIVHYNETDCDGVYSMYKSKYSDKVSYICEDRATKKYKHYN